jgi:hypothetical protein
MNEAHPASIPAMRANLTACPISESLRGEGEHFPRICLFAGTDLRASVNIIVFFACSALV